MDRQEYIKEMELELESVKGKIKKLRDLTDGGSMKVDFGLMSFVGALRYLNCLEGCKESLIGVIHGEKSLLTKE